MNPYESLLENSLEIETKIGYVFKDKKLLALAFVHSSFYNEYREHVEEHNERLEFLGDAVFGLLVSEFLYRTLADRSEGELSHLRAQIVEAPTCAVFIEKLGVGPDLLLGKGERRGDTRGRETIWADFFEALLGAIYLDGGLEEARTFFFHHFQEHLEGLIRAPMRNWKAELQDFAQKKYQKPPYYKVIKESGPDHNKLFHVVVYLDDKEHGEGQGSSKKEAEVASAECALLKLSGLSNG